MSAGRVCVSAIALAALLLAMGPFVPKAEIRRVPFDVEPSGHSFESTISNNGRWVAFRSWAQNLVPGGSDGLNDIFLVDIKKGTTLQVSRKANGDDTSQSCVSPALNATGRFVAYHSGDPDIVPGGPPGAISVFLFDRQQGTTVRVSLDEDGDAVSSASEPSISQTGRWVAFSSTANAIVTGDSNNKRDIFIRDRKLGTTTLVSRTSDGGFADDHSERPMLSDNGKLIAFMSFAALTPADTNSHQDVYVVDLKKGTLELVTVNDAGEVGDMGGGGHYDFAGNGRFVTFASGSQNLVDDPLPFATVYRRDLKTGRTEHVVVDADGNSSMSITTGHAISPDGRYIVVRNLGGDLGPEDTNGLADLYLKDMKTGSVERISIGFGGVETDDTATGPSVAKRAKWISFDSAATTLLEEADDNGFSDIFVKRR
jgi:TolB protein